MNAALASLLLPLGGGLLLILLRPARGGRWVIALSLGALVATAPSALADPAPNCSAADRAGITAGVQAATSAYLFTHPPVNDFFSTLKGKSPEDRRAALEAFMTANPQVGAELQGIRQPMKDFRSRCG